MHVPCCSAVTLGYMLSTQAQRYVMELRSCLLTGNAGHFSRPAQRDRAEVTSRQTRKRGRRAVIHQQEEYVDWQLLPQLVSVHHTRSQWGQQQHRCKMYNNRSLPLAVLPFAGEWPPPLDAIVHDGSTVLNWLCADETSHTHTHTLHRVPVYNSMAGGLVRTQFLFTCRHVGPLYRPI